MARAASADAAGARLSAGCARCRRPQHGHAAPAGCGGRRGCPGLAAPGRCADRGRRAAARGDGWRGRPPAAGPGAPGCRRMGTAGRRRLGVAGRGAGHAPGPGRPLAERRWRGHRGVAAARPAAGRRCQGPAGGRCGAGRRWPAGPAAVQRAAASAARLGAPVSGLALAADRLALGAVARRPALVRRPAAIAWAAPGAADDTRAAARGRTDHDG